MYQKFKDCLLSPKNIYKYISEKTGKFLLYFLLITLIYALPSVVNILNPSDLPSASVNQIVNIFENSNKVDYKISEVNGNYELQPTSDKNGQTVEVKVQNGTQVLSFLLIFDETVDNVNLSKYQLSSDVVDELYMAVHLGKKDVSLYLKKDLKENSDTDDGIVELANEETSAFYTISYDEIGMSTIDFSIVKDNSTVFKKQINDVYHSFYNKHKAVIAAISIPSVIFGNLLSLILEVVMLAVVIKLLYNKYQLTFGPISRIVTYAYTPRVVFNLLSIFWSSPLMYFMGQLLSIIYIMVALKGYMIDSIAKNLEQNIQNIIKQNNNEGDNNEL